jgi:hypothetical protein
MAPSYDDDLIDAAISHHSQPSTGLTALQVSGAMPRSLSMMFAML